MITRSNIDLILVKASATALVTLALFRLPELFRAVAQLVAALIYHKLTDTTGDTGALISRLNQSVIASATGDLIAFVVLILLARWMSGYPEFMRTAFKRADDSSRTQNAEQVGDGDAVEAV